MVNLVARLVLGTAVVAGPGGSAGPEGDAAVRSALAEGGYPWYDARADAVVPIWPPADPTPDRDVRLPGAGPADLGEYVAIGLAVLALAALLAMLAELWRRYRPGAGPEDSPPDAPSARVLGLPTGVSPGPGDPWDEANRCRERGDYARAVVCLFAHQLIALERLHLLRLAPGRTGRQLVRAIDDARFRGPVEMTLTLFEAVYYGHRAPSAREFEAVWSHALEFERRRAGGADA